MEKSRRFGRLGSSGTFGDKTPGGSERCAQCAALLADALDGMLSAAELELFDLHVAACGPCGQLVADARRGAAWLEMLRAPAPEPPADLLERILAQTGESARMVPGPVLIPHAGYAMEPAAITHANVIPFPRRMVVTVRRSGFGQIVLQPRLAMTAAMAFFSVALTMNLTGFHPTSLRASDLQPSSLRRDFYSADARVTQYYEGLRVVYELESRVHDLQSAQDGDAAAGIPAAPANVVQPAQPAPANQKAAPSGNQPSGSQPGAKQPERTQPTLIPGTSRREEPRQTRRFAVAETIAPARPGSRMHARMERRLV